MKIEGNNLAANALCEIKPLDPASPNPEHELEVLCDELKAWQAANGLEPMCAFEQSLCLEIDDPRRVWLEDYGVRWERAVQRLDKRK